MRNGLVVVIAVLVAPGTAARPADCAGAQRKLPGQAPGPAAAAAVTS